MSGNSVAVDVCIATFRRPGLLARLLASLARQEFTRSVTMRVIVTDNDAGETARETVSAFAARVPFPVVYDVEPAQNIALARNRCLAHAEGEFVAFVDDDEEAAPDWLERLLDAARRFGADAVFGPVLPVLPDAAPAWAVQGGFYERPRRPSGTPVSTGGTGNVIVRGESLKKSALEFNPDYGLTGGEDHEFFCRLAAGGGRLVWCDEAVVFETVRPERLGVGYLARRALRGGQVHARLSLTRYGAVRRLWWFVWRTALACAALAAACGSWPIRRSWGILCLQKFFSNLGQLSALTSIRYREYADNR